MSEKVICDKCEKDISGKERALIKIPWMDDYHLCNKCFNKFQEWCQKKGA